MKSCGGTPGQSAKIDEQYRLHSPLTYLAKATLVRLHIHAGITDRHTGSVLVSHSLLAYNKVAKADDQLTQAEIDYFVQHAKAPKHLQQQISDPSYGKKRPLFRRTSGQAIVTIFNGGHELITETAIDWI